ncbi:MAG: hypothetical protein OEY95_04455 [Candidatus Bathyarchaeota archaeon]|nr:hypothetical protein [Candidatus Bathyarchaeota archaeon]
MDLRKVWKLLRGRRAVSVVVSNVILTGAVIAVGFVVLSWTQYRSSAYNEQYGEAMNADIARLKERLAFEYVFYNYNSSGGYLSVYLMNCGTVDNVTIQTVYVTAITGVLIQVNSNVTLRQFNGNEIADLDRGEEGYFVLSLPNLISSSYSVRIVTGRGSTFDHMFFA